MIAGLDCKHIVLFAAAGLAACGASDPEEEDAAETALPALVEQVGEDADPLRAALAAPPAQVAVELRHLS